MRNAKGVLKNKQAKKTFCSAACENNVPPLLRILLNSNNPKQIEKIEHDYDLLLCERMAIQMVKDEDPDFKIKTEKKETKLTSDQSCFSLYSDKKGNALLAKGVSLSAGALKAAGPNVDITPRDNPTEGEKHRGVHTVHRLYMAAAFRLLIGGNDVGSNTGVAALIVSPTGQILAWAKKNPLHPVLHAEASALLFYGQSLPKGARIYSTLKPCKMCRAFIEHFSTGGDFVAYYGQDDPTLAAMGAMDQGKFVYLSSSAKEKPIWADADKERDPLLRETVAGKLTHQYGSLHDKKTSLGIINFIKDGKANPNLLKAANYLQVKQQKYSNPKLEETYNPNVQKCLTHIAAVMQELNLPIPTKL